MTDGLQPPMESIIEDVVGLKMKIHLPALKKWKIKLATWFDMPLQVYYEYEINFTARLKNGREAGLCDNDIILLKGQKWMIVTSIKGQHTVYYAMLVDMRAFTSSHEPKEFVDDKIIRIGNTMAEFTKN